MTTLKLLEKAIDKLAYGLAMERIQKKKNIKTWERLNRKLSQFIEEEKDKIIERIVMGGKNENSR